MISTFSSPAFFRLSATNSAARRTSDLCSGSVLMEGMRRKSFSSSRKRSRLDSTNALVAWDTHHYARSKPGLIDRRRFSSEPRLEAASDPPAAVHFHEGGGGIEPRAEHTGDDYGLVELFFPPNANPAPAAPPATAAAIPTFAPVDNPPLLAAGTGLPGAGLPDPAPAGASVFASKADATLRHPPCDFMLTDETLISVVAPAIAGRPAATVPVASTRLPVFAARLFPVSSTTS